jgi:very-short-patch-repair endonuclease
MDTRLMRRRRMRREPTDAETALWKLLRARSLVGFKFRRQYPAGPFILDFFCPARRLAIELDGGQHYDPGTQAYDQRRTQVLSTQRIRVLRFPNDAIFREPDSLVAAIAGALGVHEG